MPDNQERIDRWLQIDPKILRQLPPDVLAYIMAAVEKHGKQTLARERLTAFNAKRSRRLPADREQRLKMVVTCAGALTFSIAPQMLASQAGRGPLAFSAGILGGAAASFFAHDNATKVLLKSKLKQSVKQARQAIAQEHRS
ncbi:MAG: hypothetical protein KME17_08475 [Cyanosarcina radialis HA8281-LM2]|jgi:hypothetical protein|nr:hypothetical protein [Cyanosarcina radialis HA8281-LM2]